VKKIIIMILVSTLIVSSLFAFGTKEDALGAKRPTIVVSILPQQFVVDYIAGDFVDTITLVGPGQNPHSYEPTPKQMAQLSQADAWIVSNTDFERSLVDKIKTMYPNLLIVDGTEGVEFRLLEEHDHAGEIHHQELDKHTWLGRTPMKILAQHTLTTLQKIDPEHSSFYLTQAQMFVDTVDTLFNSLIEELAPLRGTTAFVYHPSFGYLFDELGIKQEAVETGGKEPTAKALSTLIEKGQQEKVSALFVQAQFPTSSAHNVAQAIGAEVLPLDPLAYDWFENISLMGETLKKGLKY
jgi:zinc transport system substrate-binding protein